VGVVWCGFADASPMSGLNVSLVPINSGTSFVNGTFTFPTVAGSPTATVFELSIRISGSIPVANQFFCESFATRLFGSASDGAVITDIYMSATTGIATNSTASVIAGAGTLFFKTGYLTDRINNPSEAVPVGSLPRDLLIGLNTAYLAEGGPDDGPGPLLDMVGNFTGVEIARVRMALKPNIGSGIFTLGLRNDQDIDGFLDSSDLQNLETYSFTTQPLNLNVVAVPEPATFAMLFPGLVALGGLAWRRRMTRGCAVAA